MTGLKVTKLHGSHKAKWQVEPIYTFGIRYWLTLKVSKSLMKLNLCIILIAVGAGWAEGNPHREKVHLPKMIQRINRRTKNKSWRSKDTRGISSE
jgi:hypothetical protein